MSSSGSSSGSSSSAASTPQKGRQAEQQQPQQQSQQQQQQQPQLQERLVWFTWRTNQGELDSSKWKKADAWPWTNETLGKLRTDMASHPRFKTDPTDAGEEDIALVAVNVDGTYGDLVHTYSSRRLQEWTPDSQDAQCLFARHQTTREPTHMLVFTFPPKVDRQEKKPSGNDVPDGKTLSLTLFVEERLAVKPLADLPLKIVGHALKAPLADRLREIVGSDPKLGEDAAGDELDAFFKKHLTEKEFRSIVDTHATKYLFERGKSVKGSEALQPDRSRMHSLGRDGSEDVCKNIGQVDVVTVLEYKEVSVGIKLQMSKDRREMASDAIGQTIGYGMSILNAQPWRSEVYLLLTNFKDATVVQVYREADGILFSNIYYVIPDNVPRPSLEQLKVVASFVLAFATQPEKDFGFVTPKLIKPPSPLSIMALRINATFASEIKFVDLIGTGATSRVYEASVGNTAYVVKVLNERAPGKVTITRDDFAKEAEVLQQLAKVKVDGVKNPFPVYHGSVSSSASTIVMTPVAALDAKEGTALSGTRESSISSSNIRKVIQCVQAVHAGLNIAHLDLRRSNALVNKSTKGPLIIDWGFCVHVNANRRVKLSGAVSHLPPDFANDSVLALDLRILVRVCFLAVTIRMNADDGDTTKHAALKEEFGEIADRLFDTQAQLYQTFWAKVAATAVWTRVIHGHSWKEADDLARSLRYKDLGNTLFELM